MPGEFTASDHNREYSRRLRAIAKYGSKEHADFLHEAADKIDHLDGLIHSPHTSDFLESVRLEAAHQRERWGADHDAGKADSDWFWLIGYVAGKAINNPKKLLHHIITTAAVCLNWHMARTVGNDMRPGISSRSVGCAEHE
jgi:hypothetical protein